MCIFYMCQVVQVAFLKCWFRAFRGGWTLILKWYTKHDFLIARDGFSIQCAFCSTVKTQTLATGKKSFMTKTNIILKHECPPKSVVHERNTKNDYFVKELSKKERSRTAATTAPEAFSPENPSPILHAPTDNISRKGKWPTPTCPKGH